MMSKMLEEYKLLKANWNYWTLSASLRAEGQDGEILLPGWLSLSSLWNEENVRTWLHSYQFSDVRSAQP